jgi:hypothetical protein
VARADAELALAIGSPFPYYGNMSKSITVVRKKRGRPATGTDPVTAIRLSPELRAQIDTWAVQQEDNPPRSIAIRRLVEMSLRRQSPKTVAGDALMLKRKERWGERMAELAISQRLENLLKAAAKVHGERSVAEDAEILFGMKWPKKKAK